MRNIKCNEPCLICGTDAIYHHVKSYGSGGATVKEKLMPLCMTHHTEIHMSGLMKFSKSYPIVQAWLVKNNWEICNFKKKYFNKNVDRQKT